jgi:hypothetical protein
LVAVFRTGTKLFESQKDKFKYKHVMKKRNWRRTNGQDRFENPLRKRNKAGAGQ